MGRNERAKDEEQGRDSGEIHSDGNLYDEPAKDESTGKQKETDEVAADEDLTIRDDPEEEDDEDADSPGARWLKENDK